MANVHTLIFSQTLSSGQASITIGSGGTLTQAYNDLRLIICGTSSTSANIGIQFNGDTNNANYSYVYMLGNGSTPSGGTGANALTGVMLSTGISQNEYSIMDYSSTSKQKTTLVRTGNPNGDVIAYVARWASTSAISSIVVSVNSGTFNTGTTFYLYGVSA
jgi:hypothetical protein